MRSIDITEANRNLPRLIDEAADGEGFIIVRQGRALARVTPLEAPARDHARRRGGFMAGRYHAAPEPPVGMGRVLIEALLGLGGA